MDENKLECKELIIELNDIKSFYNRTMIFWNFINKEVRKNDDFLESLEKYGIEISIIYKILDGRKYKVTINGFDLDKLNHYCEFCEGKEIENQECLYKDFNEQKLEKICFFKMSEEIKILRNKSELTSLLLHPIDIIISQNDNLIELLKRNSLNYEDIVSIQSRSIFLINNIKALFMKKDKLENYAFINIGEDITQLCSELKIMENISKKSDVSPFFYDINMKHLKKEIIGKILYLRFLLIFFLMIESPFLRKEKQEDLKKLYLLFYEEMYNSEILSIEKNPRGLTNTKTDKRGKKDNTTRLIINFCKDRYNIYKLRFDLPHKGVDKPHINFRNEDIDEFCFINKEDENRLISKLGQKKFKKIFYYVYGFKKYIFINDWENKIDEIKWNNEKSKKELKEDLKKLYEKSSHNYLEFKNDISDDFYEALEKGFEHSDFSDSSFKIEDYNEDNKEGLKKLSLYKDYQFLVDMLSKYIIIKSHDKINLKDIIETTILAQTQVLKSLKKIIPKNISFKKIIDFIWGEEEVLLEDLELISELMFSLIKDANELLILNEEEKKEFKETDEIKLKVEKIKKEYAKELEVEVIEKIQDKISQIDNLYESLKI